MVKKIIAFSACIMLLTITGFAQHLKDAGAHKNNPYYSNMDTTELHVSNAEWKKILPEKLYRVAREKDTEVPFTGEYWNSNTKGRYYCAACGNALFDADAKFASSCGWPSFYQPIRPGAVKYLEDHTHGMERMEVQCGRCGAHLGHIFNDGPAPTFKRFCMNSVSLDFMPENAESNL